MREIARSLPEEWEVIVWDNNTNGHVFRWSEDGSFLMQAVPDLSVYGRYAAIEHASHNLIYVQDDDVIVSDPQAIVDEWDRVALTKESDPAGPQPDWASHVVCNMPQEFRPHYPDSALVGFGAAFHRDAPGRAFGRVNDELTRLYRETRSNSTFHRTSDVVFTTLTPRVLVDVPKVNLPHATGDDRMYRQPEHVGERARMLELARRVRES